MIGDGGLQYSGDTAKAIVAGADTVVELTVKLPKSAKLTFLAGQYVRLQAIGNDQHAHDLVAPQ